jgi:hypothetical protein
VYSYDKQLRGRGDLAFLKFCFEKLSLNFTWWVNRKDEDENNVFSGGFLGLDNIGVFVRDHRVATRSRRRSWCLASLAPLAFSSGSDFLSPV